MHELFFVSYLLWNVIHSIRCKSFKQNIAGITILCGVCFWCCFELLNLVVAVKTAKGGSHNSVSDKPNPHPKNREEKMKKKEKEKENGELDMFFIKGVPAIF